jgi:hypothetical protein
MIELSIFNLWKQLPDLDIVDTPKQQEQQEVKSDFVNTHNVMHEDRDRIKPMVICYYSENKEGHCACGHCLRSWCSRIKPKYGDKEPVKCPHCKTVVYDPSLSSMGLK